MGSRGRMLGQAHWSMPDQFKCVDMKNGIKVLEYNGNNRSQNKLPDISHTKGTKYISLVQSMHKILLPIKYIMSVSIMEK